jgi:hypothetical protein
MLAPVVRDPIAMPSGAEGGRRRAAWSEHVVPGAIGRGWVTYQDAASRLTFPELLLVVAGRGQGAGSIYDVW